MTRWLIAPIIGALLASTVLHPAAGTIGAITAGAVWFAGGRRSALALVVLAVALANLGLRVDAADRAPRPEHHGP